VPAGDRCVFVNDDRLNAALALFAGNAAGALEVRPEDALALMLLHEAGHLAAGAAGSYTPPVPMSIDDLTNTVNISKSQELRADAFAIDAIHGAATPRQPTERFTAAAGLDTRAHEDLMEPRDTEAARRVRGERAPGASALPRPRVQSSQFRASLPCHELPLSPSETGRALLADFIEGRQPQRSRPSLLGILAR